MIALILAGKVGSNISSEIGSMRITEQIDAMEMMGTNSANFLILPKIAAATVFNPLLMLLSFILGLLGGAIIIMMTGVINISQFVDGIQFSFKQYYVFYSMIKMAAFSFVITSVASFYGYYASGGSLGVGRLVVLPVLLRCLCFLLRFLRTLALRLALHSPYVCTLLLEVG